MATEEASKALIESIDSALEYQKQSLISRTQWGSINFEKASSDLNQIFEILSSLQTLPVEKLPDTAMGQIQPQVTGVVALFKKIDGFEIEGQANPSQERDALVANAHQLVDSFYSIIGQWIPFLAFQKGDVSRNIEALTGFVKEAKSLVDEGKQSIADKQTDIDEIVTKAREASAGAGAAVFTEDFDREATSLKNSAANWLRITGILAVGTAAFALLMWFLTESGLDTGQLYQKFGSKVAVLVVMFTATLWCGRIYRALMHQSAINRHRALSLQTFQAFSHAASDNPTKDAVLMEATRAIFANTPTGYLDQRVGTQEAGSKVVEVVRDVSQKIDKTA